MLLLLLLLIFVWSNISQHTCSTHELLISSQMCGFYTKFKAHIENCRKSGFVTIVKAMKTVFMLAVDKKVGIVNEEAYHWGYVRYMYVWWRLIWHLRWVQYFAHLRVGLLGSGLWISFLFFFFCSGTFISRSIPPRLILVEDYKRAGSCVGLYNWSWHLQCCTSVAVVFIDEHTTSFPLVYHCETIDCKSSLDFGLRPQFSEEAKEIEWKEWFGK